MGDQRLVQLHPLEQGPRQGEHLEEAVAPSVVGRRQMLQHLGLWPNRLMRPPLEESVVGSRHPVLEDLEEEHQLTEEEPLHLQVEDLVSTPGDEMLAAAY